MRTIKDYMDFVKDVKNAIPRQTIRIVNENKELILDLNRKEQLYNKGIDSLGLELKPYAFFTVQIKQLLGHPYDRTTLNYSGAFYKGFKINFNDLSISFDSDDNKTNDLVGKYGRNIFGLTTENKDKLNYEIIYPELMEYIKQYL